MEEDKLNNEKTSFNIVIIDGISFRAFLDFLLKYNIKIITLVLTKNSISVREQETSSKKISIIVNFDLDKICYSFDSPNDEYLLNLNVVDVHKNIKAMLRSKNSIEINKKKKEEDISISILSSSNLDNEASGCFFTKSLSRNTTESFSLNTYDNDVEHNTIFSSVDFVLICKSYVDKTQPINITGYEEGVRFSAISHNSIDNKESELQKILKRGYIKSGKEIISYRMEQSSFKTLEKIGGFNKQNSLIKMYFDTDKPILIEFNLSYFATVKFYISDFSEKSSDE